MIYNWTGVISKNILKLKLAFDNTASTAERMKTMNAYAKSLTGSRNIKILEAQHYSDGSMIRAQF